MTYCLVGLRKSRVGYGNVIYPGRFKLTILLAEVFKNAPCQDGQVKNGRLGWFPSLIQAVAIQKRWQKESCQKVERQPFFREAPVLLIRNFCFCKRMLLK